MNKPNNNANSKAAENLPKPEPTAYGRMVDLMVETVASWPVEYQRSVDVHGRTRTARRLQPPRRNRPVSSEQTPPSRDQEKRDPIGPVRTGCLCCPPKPERAPLDWKPHPGFGALILTRDGAVPEWWHEFCDWPGEVYLIDKGWQTTEIKSGPRKGQTTEYFDGDWWPVHLDEDVTLREIEECAAEDPDHDWRLEIRGPLGGVIYQRHGAGEWHTIERLDGFA